MIFKYNQNYSFHCWLFLFTWISHWTSVSKCVRIKWDNGYESILRSIKHYRHIILRLYKISSLECSKSLHAYHLATQWDTMRCVYCHKIKTPFKGMGTANAPQQSLSQRQSQAGPTFLTSSSMYFPLSQTCYNNC